MGRNMYKECDSIQYASQEARDEKHERGQEAKERKYWGWLSEAESEDKLFKLDKIPQDFLQKHKEQIESSYPRVSSQLNIGIDRMEHGGNIEDVYLEQIESKHTKTGAPLIVVKIVGSLEREAYKQLDARVKQLNGYYSSFQKGFIMKNMLSDEQLTKLGEGIVSGGKPNEVVEEQPQSEPKNIKEAWDAHKNDYDEKNAEIWHRVFIVHKQDGLPVTDFDKLTEEDAKAKFEEYKNLPNSEITTWDKMGKNRYGRTYLVKGMGMYINKTPNKSALETSRENYHILFEMGEGRPEKNVGFNNFDELQKFLEDTKDIPEIGDGYNKNWIYFRGYPSVVRIDISKKSSDFNPETHSISDYMKKYDGSFDWSVFDAPKATIVTDVVPEPVSVEEEIKQEEKQEIINEIGNILSALEDRLELLKEMLGETPDDGILKERIELLEEMIKENKESGVLEKGGSLKANDIPIDTWLQHKTTGAKVKVWNVDPTLGKMQLQDIYGNKSNSWYSAADWKIIPKPTRELEKIKQLAEQVYSNGGEVINRSGITKEEYNKLLSDYDKFTGMYEDFEDMPVNEDNLKAKSELTKQIEETESKIHKYERNYSDGGKIEGNHVAVAESKDGYWTVLSRPTTEEIANSLLGGVADGEVGKVVSLEEARSHKKIIGEEYLYEESINHKKALSNLHEKITGEKPKATSKNKIKLPKKHSKGGILEHHKRQLDNAKTNLESAKNGGDKKYINYWQKAINKEQKNIDKISKGEKPSKKWKCKIC